MFLPSGGDPHPVIIKMPPKPTAWHVVEERRYILASGKINFVSHRRSAIKLCVTRWLDILKAVYIVPQVVNLSI
jgi:hypothetical protein